MQNVKMNASCASSGRTDNRIHSKTTWKDVVLQVNQSFIFPFPSFQNQYMVNEHRKPDQKGVAGINPSHDVI